MSNPTPAVSSIRASDVSARTRWLAPLVVALLAFATYAITLGGTYVYDDVAVVHDDPRVLQPSKWIQLWTKPYFAKSVDQLYRPLVSMSFAVENWMHGDKPWIFHLVNILLHAAVAAAVTLLGFRIGGAAVGWIAGILFAVHPVHVEAVAGLVGRSELACALFTVIGILIFLRPGPTNWWRIVGITICFIVAVLSKEQGILFPVLLLVAEPLRNVDRKSSEERQGRLWLILVLCWMLAWYLFARQAVAPLAWDRQTLDWYVNPVVRAVGADRVLVPLVILGHYVVLLVWPQRMLIDYGGLVIGGYRASWHDPYLYVGMVAVLVWVVAAAVSWRRKNPAMLFCLLALAVCYSIVANLLTLIGTIMGDRLMYMPSIFFLLAVGLIAARLPRRVVLPLVGVCVVLAMIRTETYAWLWNNRMRLYKEMVRIEPKSERAYSLLWGEYKDAGDFKDADQVAEQSLKMIPYRWEPYVMVMDEYLRKNDFDHAEQIIDQALGRLNGKGEHMLLLHWKQVIAKKRDEAITH